MIFLLLLLGGGFGGSLFLCGGTSLTLLHSRTHRAGHRPCSRSLAGINRNRANGCATSGSTCCTPSTAPFRSVCVVSSGLLFGGFAGGSLCFGLNAGLLLGGVAVGLVVQLLIGNLPILSENKDADILRRRSRRC